MAIRTFIHGSCVSRDTLAAMAEDGYELAFYSPRQSLIGLLGTVPDLDQRLDTGKLTSPFQRRSLEGTLRADLAVRLAHRARTTDLVLWDLTDERLGVYARDDGYVTRTVELIATGLDEELRRTARHIPFGQDEHFELWNQALVAWARTLTAARLDDRVILVAPDWATACADGTPTPSSYGMTAAEHTRLAARYYQAAAQRLPALHTVGRDLRTFGAVDHRWGLAPFHLGAETDRGLRAEIDALVTAPQGFPLPRPRVLATGPRTARIESSATWAQHLTLDVLRNDETIQKVISRRRTLVFEVSLPGPGTYRFRVAHRLGEVVDSIESEPLVLTPGDGGPAGHPTGPDHHGQQQVTRPEQS